MLIDAPNIFKPRNDWNIISMKSMKYISKSKVAFKIAEIIEKYLGANPLNRVNDRTAIYRKSRQIFAEMMCRYSLVTLGEIGAYIGKTHCTVIWSRKIVSNELCTN